VTEDGVVSGSAQQQQPWLHDLVVALAAPTQAWCGPDGQIRADGAQGVYHGDVRVLSKAELSVGGRTPDAVLARPDGACAVLAVGVARHLGDRMPDPTVRVDRRRRVFPGRLVEDVVVVSSAQDRVQADVSLVLAGDLAAIDDVKSGVPGLPVTPRLAAGGAVWSGRGGLVVRVDAPDARMDARRDSSVEVVWDLDLPPGGSAHMRWTCTVADPGAVVTGAVATSGDRQPGSGQTWHLDIDADDRRLSRWVQRSLEDLAALRMATTDAPRETFLGAGAPWFLTLFGRDSLWAARMLLPIGTDLAGSTLRLLASRQGQEVDADSAEEPGKILHELRRDRLHLPADAARPRGGIDLPPVYYGTVDATALWVCLLHDAWRWGLPENDVEALLPSLEAGLTWLVAHGDPDGDGFLEYVDTTGQGLTNQGWKDSGDSVRWRDGRLAEAPIALCEVQGYAYEAAVGGAALLRRFGRPSADRWLEWSQALQERFRSRFWVQDEHGEHPAIALDATKRPVDSLTSNVGHLLGTGLLTPVEEAVVASRMIRPDMSSGFGLRTLSSSSGGFSPLSYHGGSVWPHDTAIVMTGLARSGQLAAAGTLLEGLLAAADAFASRLPELYGGDARADVPAPVPYPAACRPQAWSAAAAVAALSAVTGLRPDVPAGTLTWSPLNPSPVGALRVSGLRIAGESITVHVGANGAPDRLDGTALERVPAAPQTTAP
jgi:glycogen debranching enzyme